MGGFGASIWMGCFQILSSFVEVELPFLQPVDLRWVNKNLHPAIHVCGLRGEWEENSYRHYRLYHLPEFQVRSRGSRPTSSMLRYMCAFLDRKHIRKYLPLGSALNGDFFNFSGILKKGICPKGWPLCAFLFFDLQYLKLW